MGADHGRLDVLVAEEFLNGPDVVTRHEQMGCKGMAEGVASDLFVDSATADRSVNPFSHHRFVEVVAPDGVGSRIGASRAGWEDVLPTPVGGGVGVLSIESVGEVHSAETFSEILIVEFEDMVEVIPETTSAGVREEGHSVFLTLAVSDRDVSEIEVDILDAEPKAFEDAHACAV